MADEQDVDDFLAHYGVLGMKWGVRKSPRSTIRKDNKAAKKQRRARSKLSKSEKEGLSSEFKGLNRVEKNAKIDAAKAKEAKLRTEALALHDKAVKAKTIVGRDAAERLVVDKLAEGLLNENVANSQKKTAAFGKAKLVAMWLFVGGVSVKTLVR